MTSNKSVMKRISTNLEEVIREVKRNRNLTSETHASWVIADMYKKGKINEKRNKKLFRL